MLSELVEADPVGEWIVVRQIASGGCGTVYEARHSKSDRRAALKLLHTHLVTSSEMLARFDREIRVIRSLRHPNIVQLVDAGFRQDGRPYLCMELLEGEELSKRLARDGRLAPHQALAIFEPLCEAVAAAHELAIVHRDIKASNIMLCHPTPDYELGRVVLLDFSIAKIADALAPELTATHQSLGTPSCMAPEQIHGLKTDARTDVYALGGLLFHMLTGRLPFEDSSATMTQYLHIHARRPRASNIGGVSSRLDDVIVRAMAIEPAERFSDVRSMLVATRAALRDTAVSHAVVVEEAVAIFVSVMDRNGGTAFDATLLEDLEGVLPAAERFASEHGFVPAVDLGSSIVFVARRSTVPDPVATVRAMWDHLAQRPRRDPRVQVGICVHADIAAFVGAEIQSCGLLRPAGWHAPESLEGVWVTSAIDPTTVECKRVR